VKVYHTFTVRAVTIDVVLAVLVCNLEALYGRILRLQNFI